ncbi:MAG: hypothetical protein SNF33_02250 [Candidatus Algichlamydia australiensis]|nr:hypothetical protein [Chlamydiales bacterium]
MISNSFSSQENYSNYSQFEDSSDKDENDLYIDLLRASNDAEAWSAVYDLEQKGFDLFDEFVEGVDTYDILANKNYIIALRETLKINSLEGSDIIGAAAMNFGKNTQSIIELLLANGAIPNPSVLPRAPLISQTSAPNTPKHPQTAIHWLIEAASMFGSKKDWYRGLYSQAEKDELHKSVIECVKMILKARGKNVDPNVTCSSPRPQTLLTYALMYGEIEIAGILLAHKSINPYKIGFSGNTHNCIDNKTVKITNDEIRKLLNAIEKNKNYPSKNRDVKNFKNYLESRLVIQLESDPSSGSEGTSVPDDISEYSHES